jgi:hypothetical protein
MHNVYIFQINSFLIDENQNEEDEEEEEEDEWFIEQNVNQEDDDDIKLSNNQIKYGFAQTKCNVFAKLSVRKHS